jgi:hypothetical protein
MLPAGHVSILFCGTRRAEEWRAALAAEGITAHVEETEAQDAEKGACLVAVPRDQLLVANALVTAVTQGRRRLGGPGSWLGAAIVIGVAALIVALVVVLR